MSFFQKDSDVSSIAVDGHSILGLSATHTWLTWEHDDQGDTVLQSTVLFPQTYCSLLCVWGRFLSHEGGILMYKCLSLISILKHLCPPFWNLITWQHYNRKRSKHIGATDWKFGFRLTPKWERFRHTTACACILCSTFQITIMHNKAFQ